MKFITVLFLFLSVSCFSQEIYDFDGELDSTRTVIIPDFYLSDLIISDVGEHYTWEYLPDENTFYISGNKPNIWNGGRIVISYDGVYELGGHHYGEDCQCPVEMEVTLNGSAIIDCDGWYYRMRKCDHIGCNILHLEKIPLETEMEFYIKRM